MISDSYEQNPFDVACEALDEVARTLAEARADPYVGRELALALAYDDLASMAAALTIDAARQAHAVGKPWSAVGRAFDISRQAAFQRFSRLD